MNNRKTHSRKTTLGALAVLLVNLSASALAGEKEDSVINHAIEAYGGKKLTQLQSLSFTDNMRNFSPWQSGHSSQGAMMMYLSEQHINLDIDLLNNQKVFKQATSRLVGGHGTDLPTVIHRLFTAGEGYSIDHGLQQYQTTKRVTFDNADMGNSQLIDPLIIRQLDSERDKSKWLDTAYVQGRAQDVLVVNAGKKNEYTVFLDQEKGYLTRILKNRGGQVRSYEFMDHRQTQGIVWAKQLFVSTKDQTLYYTDSRNISFNSIDDEQFNLPVDYKPQPQKQAVDVSQLTIRQLADGVYFVGQDWGYTLFIDVGDHYVSAGAWQENQHTGAWQRGLDLLRKTTGNSKPIAQHIVTHHHDDHMMGLADVLKQGANLVIHPTDIAMVQTHLEPPLAESRFVPITDMDHLANGKIQLIDVPNSHASHNLVVYLPEHKLLFTEDMFGSSFKSAFHSPNGWPSVDTYHRLDVLTEKINQLGLDVDSYVSSHHARVLSQAEIDQALSMPRLSRKQLLQRLFGN